MAQERGKRWQASGSSTRRRSRPRWPWPPSRGDKSVNALAGRFGVHPTLIHGWKKQLLSGAEAVFASHVRTDAGDAEARQAELFEQIGRLKMELEWVKKKAAAFG